MSPETRDEARCASATGWSTGMGRADAINVQPSMSMKQVTLPDDGLPPSDGGSAAPSDGGSPPARDIHFADLAETGNQRAVVNALQSLSTPSNFYLRVLNLPEGAPAGVFNSLSGEAHASAVQSLQGVSSRVSAVLLSRLQANLAAGLVRDRPQLPISQFSERPAPAGWSCRPANARAHSAPSQSVIGLAIAEQEADARHLLRPSDVTEYPLRQ